MFAHPNIQFIAPSDINLQVKVSLQENAAACATW